MTYETKRQIREDRAALANRHEASMERAKALREYNDALAERIASAEQAMMTGERLAIAAALHALVQ